MTHHYLAAYSFGANKDRLQAIYNENASYQRERPPSTGTVTEETYADQLGHRDAYTSYLEFFKTEIDARGMIDAIIYWLFLREEKDNSAHMLARTLGCAIHPLIHLGYAVEFNLPSLAAEGLAMAACSADTLVYFSPSPSLSSAHYDYNTEKVNGTERIEDIITKVKNDSDLNAIVKFEDNMKPMKLLLDKISGPKIRGYSAQWNFQGKSLIVLY